MPEGLDRARQAGAEARSETPGAAGLGLFTLPNVITLGRLCAVPAAIWLMLQHRLDLAFLVFVGAGISDAVDGWLARVLHARSLLGFTRRWLPHQSVSWTATGNVRTADCRHLFPHFTADLLVNSMPCQLPVKHYRKC